MSAGRWNDWCQVQVFDGADDGAGGQTEAGGWIDAVTCWAQIQPVSAVQLMRAGVLASEITHYVRCAYRHDLATERRQMRLTVLRDGATYQIKTLRDENGRRIELLGEAALVSVPTV